jgi:hypothetical protein
MGAIDLLITYSVVVCCRGYRDVSRSVTEGSSGYQTGVSVKTGIAKESDIEDYHVGPNLRMGLPQHTAGGYCVWPAPVRFLTETSSSCVYSASLVDMCSTFVSPLNARLYAQSSRWTGATGPQVTDVLRNPQRFLLVVEC